MSDEVLCIDPDRYKNNADIILACAEMGYLTGEVLDTTYGTGLFWSKHRPRYMVTNDIAPTLDTHYSCDFRDLPWSWRDRFSATVFDPPYKLDGTPHDRGPGEANLLYGVSTGAREYENVDEVIQLYYDGLAECVRVTKPKGYVLVKLMNQVSGAKTRWSEHGVWRWMDDHGHRQITQFYLVGSRKQPEGTEEKPRQQINPRNNYSILAVYEKSRS